MLRFLEKRHLVAPINEQDFLLQKQTINMVGPPCETELMTAFYF